MKRVLVIGHPGAGKSTLARKLGEITGLPVIHLDKEFWRPGWVSTPPHEWDRRTEGLINRESWVIDGSYTRTLDMRLTRADTVIHLDFSRYLCLWRVIRRVMKGYGRVRSDLGPGCPERIDFEFLRWVWNYRRDQRPLIKQSLRTGFHRGRMIELANPSEVREFLQSLEG
jgi:adenylate kinase family enzyme